MELRQLKYFVEVAKTLNFSEAARRLFVTQGTLSQQIMQLENELGARLFVRTPHSVALTEEGQEILPIAERTVADAADCVSHIADLRKMLTGTLSIGLTHSFRVLLSDTVPEFMKKYPGVQLKIHYKTASELYDMLLNREIDFALAYKSARLLDELDSEWLFDSDLRVIMRSGHPLAGRKMLTLEDVDRYGIALPGSGLQARKAFERFINLDVSNLNIKVELNDPNVILDIVETTDTLTILSTLATYYRRELVSVPMEGISRKMQGCILWLKESAHKRSAEAFIGMLRNSAQMRNLMQSL